MHGGPIAAAPYPLHVAGGMASRRRWRASTANASDWEEAAWDGGRWLYEQIRRLTLKASLT
ncbi:MAG: hypothetical protein WA784_14465, partial [Albidovulum sp.]